MFTPLFTDVHVGRHVIAVPNDLVDGFRQAVYKARLVYLAERSIARDAEIDDLVALMDGYAV